MLRIALGHLAQLLFSSTCINRGRNQRKRYFFFFPMGELQFEVRHTSFEEHQAMALDQNSRHGLHPAAHISQPEFQYHTSDHTTRHSTGP